MNNMLYYSEVSFMKKDQWGSHPQQASQKKSTNSENATQKLFANNVKPGGKQSLQQDSKHNFATLQTSR